MKPVTFPDRIADKLLELRQEGYSGTIMLDTKDGMALAVRRMEEVKA